MLTKKNYLLLKKSLKNANVSENSLVNNIIVRTCVLFHVGNIAIFKEIYNDYKHFLTRDDILIFISTHTQENIEEIKSILPNADVEQIENRGCDIGGYIKNIIRFLKHPLYSKINYIYFIQTKTNKEWRNNMLSSLLNFYKSNETIMSSNEPVLIGNKRYTYRNNKLINMYYIKQIYLRNKHIFDNYFQENDLFKFADKYYFNVEMFDLNLINKNRSKLFFNPQFYKNYEPDLNNMSDEQVTEHYNIHGKNEFHRIPNPNFIKYFGKENYFIAGTVFACNKNYFKIFENMNLEYEFSILELGYNINDIPRMTHSWEYLFGLLIYARGFNITSIDIDGTPCIIKNDGAFNINIYKNCNIDISHYSDSELIEHYNNHGKYENIIVCKNQLYKNQSIINIDIEKSTIAFYMLIPGSEANSGGYRTLLLYINHLRNNGYNIDLYFGNSTDDMTTYLGLSINNNSLDSIIKNIAKYNILDIKNYNYFIGLNLQKKYNIIVANAWQISESVYLNKLNANHLVYIIQDKEELFYPDNVILQQKVRNTYKSEFNYYCLSSYLFNEFKSIVPNSNIIKSCLGIDNQIYYNKNEDRENSIIIAYYKNKVGRLPKLVENIISLLYKQYKCYIFPDNYTLITHNNIINLNTLTPTELNNIYNKSKIGIVFSNSNPSRLGFEMISSGLQVIEYDSIYTKYDMPSKYFTKILNIDNLENIINNLMNNIYTYPQDYINNISVNNELTNMLNLFNNLSYN